MHRSCKVASAGRGSPDDEAHWCVEMSLNRLLRLTDRVFGSRQLRLFRRRVFSAWACLLFSEEAGDRESTPISNLRHSSCLCWREWAGRRSGRDGYIVGDVARGLCVRLRGRRTLPFQAASSVGTSTNPGLSEDTGSEEQGSWRLPVLDARCGCSDTSAAPLSSGVRSNISSNSISFCDEYFCSALLEDESSAVNASCDEWPMQEPRTTLVYEIARLRSQIRDLEVSLHCRYGLDGASTDVLDTTAMAPPAL